MRIEVTDDLILVGKMPGGRTNDPVGMALAVLCIKPIVEENGVRYNNARILRHYALQLGERRFRELVHRQWRENKVEGSPRHAGAFMDKLYRAWYGKPGVKRHAKVSV